MPQTPTSTEWLGALLQNMLTDTVEHVGLSSDNAAFVRNLTAGPAYSLRCGNPCAGLAKDISSQDPRVTYEMEQDLRRWMDNSKTNPQDYLGLNEEPITIF